MDQATRESILRQCEYYTARRIEQKYDNENRKGSVSEGTALGVDYHVMRKNAATILRNNLIPNYMTAGNLVFIRITRRHLNANGKQFFDQILATGVTYPTIIDWINKYDY